MSNALYFHPNHDIEALCLPQSQNPENQLLSYNCNTILGSTHDLSFPIENLISQYNDYGSPNGVSSLSDNVHEFEHKLRELEIALLGPDIDFLENYGSSGTNATMNIIPRGDLKSILIACAKAVSENDFLTSQWLIAELRQMVSVSGEPIQRLGAYMLEGLVARISCETIKCEEIISSDLLSYTHILHGVCPYFKFGYLSANGAIAEAMKDEKRVHIIDFQIGQGSQWVTLIKAFAARPGGPPHIRITGIDATSVYARGGGLNIVGQKLCKLAELCNVPFEFCGVKMSGIDLEPKNLEIRSGEALAVNFAYVLHQIAENHRDRILRQVKGLSPKVVTLVEQECNANASPFLPRFLEALDYYNAMFESIDVTLPREHEDRINVERHCLARDVMNVITCEGIQMVERHERLVKWKSRFARAGFRPYPLSSLVNATIRTLLKSYNNRYRLEERDGALYLGWMSKDLIASSAWK